MLGHEVEELGGGRRLARYGATVLSDLLPARQVEGLAAARGEAVVVGVVRVELCVVRRRLHGASAAAAPTVRVAVRADAGVVVVVLVGEDAVVVRLGNSQQ